ncbi:MAG: prolipoprotein diacylglyceryl transferase [Treponema sp.]|nr:prolipoprotein diacylglyceryl transferase [Treponema sp.]
MNFLYIPFPSWLSPEIIPGIPIRWYGIMYILAFGTAFLLYQKQVRERNFPISSDQLSGLFSWGIAGLLLGARIFATIVYETSNIYREQPWLVFWPFRNGQFTGLAGMSYHGGVIGGLAGFISYSLIKKLSVREISDMFAASIPLGYTFGRIGNFINGELYGRVTTGPLGMLFPYAEKLPTREQWVQEAAEKVGIVINNDMVNLPRYPSQLFEAFFEGIFLWAIVWLLRNRKPFKGFLWALYIGGYGLIRFILEYFREPDSDLGYRLEFISNTLAPAKAHPLLSFSTGQILSFFMIIAAIVALPILKAMPHSHAISVYPVQTSTAKTVAKKKGKRKRR